MSNARLLNLIEGLSLNEIRSLELTARELVIALNFYLLSLR